MLSQVFSLRTGLSTNTKLASTFGHVVLEEPIWENKHLKSSLLSTENGQWSIFWRYLTSQNKPSFFFRVSDSTQVEEKKNHNSGGASLDQERRPVFKFMAQNSESSDFSCCKKLQNSGKSLNKRFVLQILLTKASRKGFWVSIDHTSAESTSLGPIRPSSESKTVRYALDAL